MFDLDQSATICDEEGEGEEEEQNTILRLDMLADYNVVHLFPLFYG